MTNYPLRHISVRVPWHDNGWNGTVCMAPKLNGACLKLPRIAENRKDESEEDVAGRQICDLPEGQWPACVAERAMFMAPFEYIRTVNHPYANISRDTHGHFSQTPQRNPPYSAPAVPFLWMRKENMEHYSSTYNLDLNPDYEPNLGFNSGWVQDRRNHQMLLDCFFGHIYPNESLCFFYAKKVPLVEDNGRRILIGVGQVKNIGQGIEYNYSENRELRSLVWERFVQHTIRPEFHDGFLLPYHAAIELAEQDSSFDPAEIVAYAPDDRLSEFSYTSEHVTHDGAIGALLACSASLKKAQEVGLDGPWERCLRWIDERLSEIWTMRGPNPGLGAALSAFGVEMGTFIAREIAAKLEDNEDPWPMVDQVFNNPQSHLTPYLAGKIGQTLRDAWRILAPERRALLQLLSRFELTPEQSKLFYVTEEREKAGILCSDKEILENPYLLYETSRHMWYGVSVWTVDRGVFPSDIIRNKHPLPEPTALDSGTDARRVRALTVHLTETAAEQGHTLWPRKEVILGIRKLSLEPPCEITQDIMAVVETTFEGVIEKVELNGGDPAYQLDRLVKMCDIIRRTVNKRMKGRRHTVKADWRKLLDDYLGSKGADEDELEEKARQEKATALKELAESRISVLIGSAGTGKTTLLSVLCGHSTIAEGEVLLLAPTGKARVKMEQTARKLNLKAYTLAQFLSESGRYDGRNQRYQLSDRPPEGTARTVIVDESSMLTEEMLAALLQAVRGVHRLILVGDPQQLPPIGPGRPFVDIVSKLRPENVHNMPIRVGPGYAELTVRRRQQIKAGQEGRSDLQLAEWFSGRPLGPGEDEVFEAVSAGGSQNIEFVQWDTPQEFQDQLLDVLVKELKDVESLDDARGFGVSLGGVRYKNSVYYNAKWKDKLGAASQAEAWQILSPVRGLTHGVSEINRLIHKRFKAQTIASARRPWRRKIPKPMGEEEIVYGDKVINVINHHRSGRNKVFPLEGAAGYIANGEIGIVVGQFKTKNMNKAPWALKVEFSSQPGYQYQFTDRDFDREDTGNYLELAYALTVHKAQGSEFGLVILVLPNPCFLLSRELLYTALTRQRDRVIIMHQGNRSELKKYASDIWSDTAMRYTNLFDKPKMVEAKGHTESENRFLEERLIHRTCDGTLVRSKSEVIIYDRLVSQNFIPLYEKALTLGGFTKYPDFTIEDEDTGINYFWEHCGMLHDPGYRQRWERKLQWYRKHNILPYEEGGGDEGTLIVTKDTSQGGISSQEIDLIIREVMLE